MTKSRSPLVPAKAGTQSSEGGASGLDSRLRGNERKNEEADKPLTLAEARVLLEPFAKEDILAVAVSGGPDSTALLWLAAQWRAARKSGPDILALTVDHGLRKESAREASAVKALARRLVLGHRTLRWQGDKPKTGLQEAARDARYALLAAAAGKAKARILLTAHTLDDQAETVLFRLLRGSGPAGLQAMAAASPCPGAPWLTLARPLLAIPKARLVATLRQAGIPFAEDPSNRDPRHTRPRLRALMPQLEAEGLSAARLALLARRLRRTDEALRRTVAQAQAEVSLTPKNETRGEGTRIVLDREGFRRLPDEIAIRLLGDAIGQVGHEGPVELGKLESLFDSLYAGEEAVRRSLAGAVVTQGARELVVEPAPPRRRSAGKLPAGRISALTTRKTHSAARDGTR
jgi:tRNA(Ile)-lysidine synthase